MSDDRLDTLIDHVAREMTSAPHDARLADRVSARIAEAGDTRVAWLRPWVLVPIASACVVLLAVFVARDGSVQDVRLKPDATPGAANVELARPNVGRGVQPRAAQRPTPARRAPRALPELQPLKLASIGIDRLDVAPLVDMNEIEISPIALDRIEISAMP